MTFYEFNNKLYSVLLKIFIVPIQMPIMTIFGQVMHKSNIIVKNFTHPKHNFTKYPLSPLNRGVWCSLNNTYQTFLTLCIRCTDHLCDSCALSDINQHFIPSLLPVISKCWPIVTSSTHEPAASNCDVTMTDCSLGVSMDVLLSQWLSGPFLFILGPHVSTRGITSSA